jgi:hypothetical protein
MTITNPASGLFSLVGSILNLDLLSLPSTVHLWVNCSPLVNVGNPWYGIYSGFQ